MKKYSYNSLKHTKSTMAFENFKIDSNVVDIFKDYLDGNNNPDEMMDKISLITQKMIDNKIP